MSLGSVFVPPARGQKRSVRKFAWLPTKLVYALGDAGFVWLQSYIEVQEFVDVLIDDEGYLFTHWKTVYRVHAGREGYGL